MKLPCENVASRGDSPCLDGSLRKEDISPGSCVGTVGTRAGATLECLASKTSQRGEKTPYVRFVSKALGITEFGRDLRLYLPLHRPENRNPEKGTDLLRSYIW